MTHGRSSHRRGRCKDGNERGRLFRFNRTTFHRIRTSNPTSSSLASSLRVNQRVTRLQGVVMSNSYSRQASRPSNQRTRASPDPTSSRYRGRDPRRFPGVRVFTPPSIGLVLSSRFQLSHRVIGFVSTRGRRRPILSIFLFIPLFFFLFMFLFLK